MKIDIVEKQKKYNIIPQNTTISGILSRRKNTKGGIPRFYVFSDQDKLLISCEAHIDHTILFRISGSSLVYEKAHPHYLGKLVLQPNSNIYEGFIPNLANPQLKSSIIQIKYLRDFERNTGERQMIVVTSDAEQKQQFKLDQKEFSSIRKIYPDIKIEPSEKNFYLEYEGKHCFSLSKQFDDEYHISIAHPLSLFTGFCLALSTFQKVSGE